MAWQDDLQPASWNGVPFGVDVGETTAGRNTAVHAYPFRESNPVWVEDLGLAPTPTRITGYLIGDDVADQQNTMIAAMQMQGPGELVHPMRGALTGSVVGGCRFVLRKDKGRVVEITFEFIESSANPYPDVGVDTQGVVAGLLASAKDSVLGDMAISIGSGLQQAQQAVREVQSVGRQALSIAGSASSIARSIPGVSGGFARFSGASGVSGVLSGLSAASSTVSTINRAPAQIAAAVAKVQGLAAQLT